MKHQKVSVDYWEMGKVMVTYGFLVVMVWLMLRLFAAVFMLPRRLRNQQDNVQHTLTELKKRFPDLNITEQDLKDAEKELEEFMKEENDKDKIEDKAVEESNESESDRKDSAEILQPIEDKKTI